MANWPNGWDQRLSEVGVTVPGKSGPVNILQGAAKNEALVGLAKDVFEKINYEPNEEIYQAICIEMYPGGKLDHLAQAVQGIAGDTYAAYIDTQELPQDVLSQVQRQIIAMDDGEHLSLYSDDFKSEFGAFKALQIACQRDPEIAEKCKPKSLGGSFGAQLHYTLENVPFTGDAEETAQAIIGFKDLNGVDAFTLKKSFIVKAPSKETQRCGIKPNQEVGREEWTYGLQQILGNDFGVPPTIASWTQFNGKLQWCSIQSFIQGAQEFDGQTDNAKSNISNEEIHKFLLDIMAFSTDRALRNAMVDQLGKVHLIDNGLNFPDPIDKDSLREGQLEWMCLPQAVGPLGESNLVNTLKNVNIDTIIEDLSARTNQVASRSHGVNQPMSQKTKDLTHLTLLLVQVGMKENVSMQQIGMTLAPIRKNKKLIGGEILDLMQKVETARSQGQEPPWGGIEEDIFEILNKDAGDRKQHERMSFLADFVGTVADIPK